jgi:hypothetical protein
LGGITTGKTEAYTEEVTLALTSKVGNGQATIYAGIVISVEIKAKTP